MNKQFISVKQVSFILCCFLFTVVCLPGCKKNDKINEAEVLHQNQLALNQVIIYDVFTPPVASRIYAYTSLASYEAMRYADPKYNSLITQLKGFANPPVPEKGKSYNYTLAASAAFFTVAHQIIFSKDTLIKYEKTLYAGFHDQLDDSTFDRSMAFGQKIGKLVLKRASVDNYPQTRGKPKYLGNNGHAQWRPTPPDYFDGVEYCWGTMKPLLINSSTQFPLPHPAIYSTDKNSPYFKQCIENYELSKHMTPEMENIAFFWDDNPFAVMHDGHTMYALKKISPGGHWMNITRMACRLSHASAIKTAQAYALTAIGLFDSFICGWQAKYEYSFIRPVSAINEMIDPNWLPFLQTPPFPEYPAGHSDVSAASSVILTHEFGNNFAFLDTTEVKYIGKQRHFTSFYQAANETAMSRFYGQIHFRSGTMAGAFQGKEIGNFIMDKLKLYK
jgi:hypothetical protein